MSKEQKKLPKLNQNMKTKGVSNKGMGDCDSSESSSHTQFFRLEKHGDFYERITTDEYFGISDSASGSSDTFHCVHGPEGKNYTKKELTNRNLKRLDKVTAEAKWTDHCKPIFGWEVAEHLAFLIRDPTVNQQKHRIILYLEDIINISKNGYNIQHLDNMCTIINYLIEEIAKDPNLKQYTITLLQNIAKPILLNKTCDTGTYFESLSNYMEFLGYLLMRIEDDGMFDLVSKAFIWHLAAPDTTRAPGTLQCRYALMATAPRLFQTVARMIALASSHRFPTYLTITLLLACHSAENCTELLKDNIIENIFYRFNPYFPDRKLPEYDINPADPQDINLKLGDSSVHMSTTLSLLLVLLKTTHDNLTQDPMCTLVLPCPDFYAQRCFVWAYRYECRARGHHHQRNTLTSIAMALLHCFGKRLDGFSQLFMSDIMTLSVITELPPRNDWTSTVNFNTSQLDVNFKKLLIYFSTNLLKVFPHNKFIVESRYWLLGLMYLLDPGLCYLRARWSQPLFAELRKTALQALVCAVPRIAPNLVKEYGLIRRTMWYIEWYSESPYEMPILYWCLRLLQVSMYNRNHPTRQTTMKDMADTHGLIILIHLCYTLLEKKTPPVEKGQAVLGLCLRMLTSAVETKDKITCCVYPYIQWPAIINKLATKILDVVLYSLDKHYIISDRLLISLLNFIWEGIIWKKENREKFIAKDGIYKLLDIVTMTRAPVQCIALALICDATKAGDAVGQLVSWRANLGAANTHPNVVRRGATIATLLAAVFRDDCLKTGVRLDHNSVLKDLESPIMSSDVRKQINSREFRERMINKRTPQCLAAADVAGSRMSKAFALLSMLCEHLDNKVVLADEAYKLYKNIRLEVEDETMLVLCAHYLTLKLNEVWLETEAQSNGFLPHDNGILEEFLHIGNALYVNDTVFRPVFKAKVMFENIILGLPNFLLHKALCNNQGFSSKGWSKEIKGQQQEVVKMYGKKESDEENSLYEFLGRVRLNIALDALRDVRCMARSADRARVSHALLQDAVRAHHRRSISTKAMRASVLKTYGPTLDAQNITGHNVKVFSIHPKDKPKPLNIVPSSE